MQRLTVVLGVLLITVSVTAQTVDVAPATPAAQALQSLVIADAGAEGVQIRNFYGPNGYRNVWTRNGRPTAQALSLINVLESTDAKGLRAADYDAGRWSARLSDLTSDAAQARFDVALTAAVIRYANDIHSGRTASPYSFYAADFVNRVAIANDAASLIASIEPQTDEYRRLIDALATYRRIATTPDEPLPVVTKLVAGDTYDALPQLAAKLRRLGDLPTDTIVSGTKYEGAIVDAVKHFQARHGLDDDGIIAKGTFAVLNVPASQRVQQIEVALERERWTTPIEAPAIVVNIPEFRLHAIGETELTMRVVVGKAAGHQTPVFDDEMTHVVFRPYWGVPPSIQRNEIGPKLDAAYAARNKYEIVDDGGRVLAVNADTVRRVRNGSLQVRQKPGTSNALGLVKFLFPNDNNVYFHSTPQQALFARTRRDFSHGCVRVEDPVALAEWTLREKTEWTKEKIKATIDGKQDDVYVRLERPIPVRIRYQTVVVQQNGDVHFYADIYGQDAKLVAALTPAQTTGGVMIAAK